MSRRPGAITGDCDVLDASHMRNLQGWMYVWICVMNVPGLIGLAM